MGQGHENSGARGGRKIYNELHGTERMRCRAARLQDLALSYEAHCAVDTMSGSPFVGDHPSAKHGRRESAQKRCGGLANSYQHSTQENHQRNSFVFSEASEKQCIRHVQKNGQKDFVW